MTLLDVRHVQKIYKTRFQGNQVEALKDIHFTVEKGDYVAIMGESGSGKSTLLNCAEVGRRNRILTNYRFLSHSLL